MDALTIINIVFFGLVLIYGIYIAKTQQFLPKWLGYVIIILTAIDIIVFLLQY
jgi:hypothetical protein